MFLLTIFADALSIDHELVLMLPFVEQLEGQDFSINTL